MDKNFSLKMLSSFDDFRKSQSYVKSFFKKIGSGSSRDVFKISDDRVLKLAKNKEGILQNEEEYDKSLSEAPFFAKIYQIDDDSKWLVMEYASKIKNSLIKSLYGVSFDMISDSISLIFNNISSKEKIFIDIDKKTENMFKDFIKWMKNEPTNTIHFSNKLGNLMKNILIYMKENRVRKADIMDWFTSDNWGIVKRNDDYEMVIIDMGLN